MKYKEYKDIDYAQIASEVLLDWKKRDIFNKSIESREGNETFTFYEGPPSANGTPGIHHVMARGLKDLFCRYKTLKGLQVKRKGGWDTHGLPVEIQVEKELGITKEDIGKKISIEAYNQKCREAVMKFKKEWDDLTEKIGYWVDLEDPYITCDKDYMESIWFLLKKFYDKDLLYKGYTIQPYSPAAGTGLSSHELNQPGCYKMIKDTSVTAQFKIKNSENDYFLAWTTTPWTLPANSALAVGKNIDYVKVSTFNQYTFEPINVILAETRVDAYFQPKAKALALEDYKPGDNLIPYKVVDRFKGSDLAGVEYEQLLPYVPLEYPAFTVVIGDYITTEDGTGIVHISKTFGADDYRTCVQYGIPGVTVPDEQGMEAPIVDKKGRFVKEITDFAGMYVKNYEGHDESDPDYKSTDVLIAIKLKEENKAFKVEKYEHSYPHCWRTDKPVLYYPLDSWFIKTTAYKEKLIRLNKTINWKPEATGTGRFGNWLANLVDWNLSRSRYWGTPLPIWRSEDNAEEICIGSLEELRKEIEKSIAAGFMLEQIDDDFDLHRPYVDNIILVSVKGQKMFREPDLIDVWFDSGAMPYAQWHYPFDNEETFKKSFPADYIAEGVDQTRGWFFTLHAIATMLFDNVAFKNVIANGLVLDKHGNKMSKRLGNAVDPFKTLNEFGPDATRWYMITNANPWDDLKFNTDGIKEVQRRFFGTLQNTYSFFALYANLDGFNYAEEDIPIANRPESDRWIISKLNSLIKKVDGFFTDYEPTKASRAIQDFVIDDLSNWYVRLNRKRFWVGDYTTDKQAAYQTLYTCLVAITKLASPVAPFYMDRLFQDLNTVSEKEKLESVHLGYFPKVDETLIDLELEEKMRLSQQISSLVHSLRKKEKIKVRQPLAKVLIPILDPTVKEMIHEVEDLIKTEVNVKAVEYIDDTAGIIVKKAKPNFRLLGQKYGSKVKEIAAAIKEFGHEEINVLEKGSQLEIHVGEETVYVVINDVEILSEDIPGWLVANDGNLTVALDVNITEELKMEGIARDLVNRVQNMRKDMGLEVQDKIMISIGKNEDLINDALIVNKEYICRETQALSLDIKDNLSGGNLVEMDDLKLLVKIDV